MIVKIVGKGATDCTEEKGINVVKAIYSACGPPAAGAAQAMKNAKLNRHVILVGFDFCCGEAEALIAGSRMRRWRSSGQDVGTRRRSSR